MIDAVVRPPAMLYTPSGDQPFGGYEYVNYRAEIDRALTKAASVQESDAQRIMVVFGYPGNGKRAFCQELARRLHAKSFHVLLLDVSSLIGARGNEPEQAAEFIREALLSTDQRPMLFVIDGLDLLKPSLRENPKLVSLREVILFCSTDQCAERTLVVATAKSPDVAIGEFGPIDLPTLQFFNWPDPIKAAEFFRIMKVPTADAVIGYIFTYCREQRLRYTAGSLINGARQALRMISSASEKNPGMAAPGEIEPKRLADLVMTFCTPTPEDEARDYLIEHEVYLSRAI